MTPPRVVDVHTHMYPPSYVRLLEARTAIPLIRTFPGAPDPRYIILPAEAEALASITTSSDTPTATTTSLPGRPITSHYTSVAQKIHFMDTHAITTSVLSLANPWLDFVAPADAVATARQVNAEFAAMCAAHPARLFFFAALPLTAPRDDLLAYIAEDLSPSSNTSSPLRRHCRGVILGTSGLGTGAGLDDPELLPVLHALAEANLLVFLHPHYGLPSEVWGPRAGGGEYGHVLPLALGFPMETTIAVARLYLAGVFDAVPDLRLLLAHSGGTLPFLAGRIESCVVHDGALAARNELEMTEGRGEGEKKKRKTIWQILAEHVYLDAVIYSAVGLQSALAASETDRLMFGTDHPFFPPVGKGADPQGEWESMTWNRDAVLAALGGGDGGDGAGIAAVMGGNAVRVLRLDEEA